MEIIDATRGDERLSLRERSMRSFFKLSRQVDRRETGNEPLVGEEELRACGFLVQPFWLEVDDVEGACYQTYREAHPEFELQVRRGVADRLVEARQSLPDSWRFVLKAGFRPLEVQYEVLEAFVRESRRVQPEWSEEAHLAHARTFVADPSILPPPHTTGGAVDIEIYDTSTGSMIDMGGNINQDSDVSFLHYPEVSPTQQHHRMVLLDAMMSVGFAPNPYEWWHFQYGEAYWAAFYGHEATLYDVITL